MKISAPRPIGGKALEPRFVVAIEFDVGSIYMTSHDYITGVPGVVFYNVLQAPNAISQRIVPDEGRSEIGSLSFTLIDKAGAFSEEIRARLADGIGLRGRRVRFYVGYTRFANIDPEVGGFLEGGFFVGGFIQGVDPEIVQEAQFGSFDLFLTQIIVDCEEEDGTYNFTCADITREERKEIFEPKVTTLRDSIDNTTPTIPVYSTEGFQPVYHGPDWSDAPNGVYGYLIIDKEVIRYPFDGVTPDAFTGCFRGVLNTRPVPHIVDPDDTAEQRPKVEEYIYLELPAVKLAYAILTGIIHNSGTPMQTLPAHWHCGIDPALVKLEDFIFIGPDLWWPGDDSLGFPVMFKQLKTTDAKRFLETEIYMLVGLYSPIYSDGRIGLRRMNEVLADAPYVALLNERLVVEHDALKHDYSGMFNQLAIDWNWNGERYTRYEYFFDPASVLTHKLTPLKRLSFKGLQGTRHTAENIRRRINAFRDRYTQPPERIKITVYGSLDYLDIGDLVKLQLQNVRDFAAPTTTSLFRTFEIQRKSIDYVTGDLELELFGSTGRAVEKIDVPGSGFAVPDDFYPQDAVPLASVCTIVVSGSGVGVIQIGRYTLAANTIYYYEGDLVLSNGAELALNEHCELRVRGFFTINGLIDGIGRGKLGQADNPQPSSVPGQIALNVTTPGLLGFGVSRGMDGVTGQKFGGFIALANTSQPAVTVGEAALNRYDITIDLASRRLLGVPTDLMGTSGGAGGRLAQTAFQGSGLSGVLAALGGTGGNSGCGLVLLVRGLAFGASGSINLSGGDAPATNVYTGAGVFGSAREVYPGAGGAGAPGALLVLLDGPSVLVPDLGGHFFAVTGSVPVQGNPLPGPGLYDIKTLQFPLAGYQDPDMISQVDFSNAAYRVQRIEPLEVPQEDGLVIPPPPTALAARSGNGYVTLTWVSPAPETYDEIEVYGAIFNNRPDAVLLATLRADTYAHNLPTGGTRFYWVRSRRYRDGPDVYSDFEPAGAQAGVTGIAAIARKLIARGGIEVYGSVIRKVQGGSSPPFMPYDADFYTLDHFPICHVAFKASQTNADIFVGLDSNPFPLPAEGAGGPTIDFAIYVQSDGDIEIYEEGVFIGEFGQYATGDLLAVVSTGTQIRYLRNGAELRTVSASGDYHAHGAMEDIGSAINSFTFGPGTVIGRIDTGQISPHAATDLYTNKAKANNTITTQDTTGDPSAPDAFESILLLIAEPGDEPYDVVVRVNLITRYISAGATPEWFWKISKTNFGGLPAPTDESEYGEVEPVAGTASQEPHAFSTRVTIDADGLDKAISFSVTKGPGANVADFMSVNTAVLTAEVIKR